MDDFGIFTESFGLKPQGKSAPMASSKRSQNSSNSNGSFSNHDFQSNTNTNFPDVFGGHFDPISKNLNGPGLRSSSMPNNYDNHLYDNDNYDIFGGMPGLKTSSSSVNNQTDDFFASFGSGPKQNGVSVDDLLENLGGNKTRSNSLGGKSSNGFDDLIPGFGGKSPSATNGGNVETRRSKTVHPSKSAPTLFEDPFVVLESTSIPSNASFDVFSDPLEELGRLSNSGRSNVSPNDMSDPFDIFSSSVSTNGGQSSNGSMKTSNKYSARETADDVQIRIPKIPPFKAPTNGSIPSKPPSYKPSQVSKPDKVKSSNVSTIGEFEDFAKGKVRNNPASHVTSLKDATERFEVKFKEAKELRERKANTPRNRETPEAKKDNKKNSEDDVGSFFSSRSRSAPRSRASTADNEMGTPSSIKKVAPVINIVDDLASIFGADMSKGQFEEVDGESEERRTARWERYCRTNDRVAQAMADMNQRDLQLQREQEEKHRISETLDGDIKRWAAGKEGNLRALLSSLQYVLWSESGWQAISLTDIITSASVKKVYRKANLCIHPDKVQQKGANLEQKYVAEKVFDILQEAWNKFNKEELS